MTIARATKVARILLAIASVALWLLLLRPQALGGPAAYLVIRGDSMLPTYESGDLLILHAADRFGVGDVVAYRVPEGEFGEGHLVVHRIVAGDGAAGFVLEGDNNPAPDPWLPKSGDVVGRPWVAIPRVGALIAWARQPVVLGGLAAAMVVALVVSRPVRRPVASPYPTSRVGVRWGVRPRAPRTV
jgi:signal peptidase